MTTQPISANVERVVRRDFPPDRVPEVLAILNEYGTESWHYEVDRVRLAALKIAAGSLEELRIQIKIAKTDYRDVLAPAENPPRDTVVDQRIFRLRLPSDWWSCQPSSDGMRWTYRRDIGFDGFDQLTISLLSSTKCLQTKEQLVTLKRVTELRRRAETEKPDVSGVTMTDTTFDESGGVQAARFGGIESGTKRRFSCLLLCSPSAVIVFYYEAVGLSQQEADACARIIFNSVRVSG